MVLRVTNVDEKREQVALQCAAVAHLAGVLAGVRKDYAALIRGGRMDDLLDSVGAETAQQMNLLGDILNGMDAVAEGDEWLTPIFEEARRMFGSDKDG
jgi:hypothetical protein